MGSAVLWASLQPAPWWMEMLSLDLGALRTSSSPSPCWVRAIRQWEPTHGMVGAGELLFLEEISPGLSSCFAI